MVHFILFHVENRVWGWGPFHLGEDGNTSCSLLALTKFPTQFIDASTSLVQCTQMIFSSRKMSLWTGWPGTQNYGGTSKKDSEKENANCKEKPGLLCTLSAQSRDQECKQSPLKGALGTRTCFKDCIWNLERYKAHGNC